MKKLEKKITILFMTIFMLMTSVPVYADNLLDETPGVENNNAYSADSTAHTQNEAVSWAKNQIGKSIDTDNYPPGQIYQCVDLVKAYYQYLGVTTPSGNAEAYRYKNVPSGWTRVYGNYKPGDVAVWKPSYRYGYYSTGATGHVGIITAADSSFVYVINQNFSGTPRCTQNRFPIQVLASAIRPDFNSSTAVTYLWKEWVENVSQTNACIYGQINMSRRIRFTRAGVNIWNSSGALIHQSSENTGVTYHYLKISYNVSNELHVTLLPGQTYTYQMWAEAEGRRYYGNKKSFTTTPVQTSNQKKGFSLSSSQKRRIEIRWGMPGEYTGVQVQFSNNAWFIGAKSWSGAGTGVNIVNATSGRYYYVRIRYYRMNGNKYIYTNWESTKRIKVK